MANQQRDKIARFRAIGYTEHYMVRGVAIMIRQLDKGHCGQAVFNDGTSKTIRSGDVSRFLNKEKVDMKTYTKKQLEGMTSPELVALYNEHADKPVKKFASKPAAIKRVQELAKAKNASKVAAKKKPAPKDKAPSKMTRAMAIYEAGITKGLARKEIIQQFISKAGLTEGGAPTYYQLCRKRAEA